MKTKDIFNQYKKDEGRVFVFCFFTFFLLLVALGTGFGWETFIVSILYIIVNAACWIEARIDLKKTNKLKDEGFNV